MTRTIIIENMTFVHPEDQPLSIVTLLSCYKNALRISISDKRNPVTSHPLVRAWKEYLLACTDNVDRTLKSIERLNTTVKKFDKGYL